MTNDAMTNDQLRVARYELFIGHCPKGPLSEVEGESLDIGHWNLSQLIIYRQRFFGTFFPAKILAP